MQQNKKKATWKWRSMEKVQLEKRAALKNTTRKKINCHSEIRKNAQENYTIVHKRITGR